MAQRILILIIFVYPSLLYAQKRTFIQKIIPDNAVLQYAGDIGFLSAGIGYVTRNKKCNGELLYGYVPKSVGGIAIHSMTAKFTWSPVRRVYHTISVNYISAGLYANYTFGKQYFAFSPSFYPYDYYDNPTALHFGVFEGGAMTKGRLSIYYELGTNGEEILSYVGNRKSLSLTDILSLGMGLRISLH